MPRYSRSETHSKRILRTMRWALEAGSKALDVFESVDPRRKADDSYVTDADRDIESYLRTRIEREYPDAHIVGEEEGVRAGSGDQWYLDPIDGTAAYATDLPIWAVSIGIWRDRTPLEGVLYAPYMDDLYVRTNNRSFKNGAEVSVSGFEEWSSESLLCVPSDTHRRYRIDFPGKTRCLGSTAYHMAMAADGRAVGALIGTPHIWDIAAMVAFGGDQLQLKGIGSGTEPDWDRLRDGESPAEPLIFGVSSQIEPLIDRVKSQS